MPHTADLTEFSFSTKPDDSELATTGGFLANEGTGCMEKLICASVSAQPLATKKAGENDGTIQKETVLWRASSGIAGVFF